MNALGMNDLTRLIAGLKSRPGALALPAGAALSVIDRSTEGVEMANWCLPGKKYGGGTCHAEWTGVTVRDRTT